MDSTEIDKRTLALNDLRHETEDGIEFWYARDLMGPLGYSNWQNFEKAVDRAMQSCDANEKTPARHHFIEVSKMIPIGKGGRRRVRDYMLTRYACYLVAMNGDARKEQVAFAQAYFALMTRSAELVGQRMGELRRLEERGELSVAELHFAAVAFERDVDSKDFAKMKSLGDYVLFGENDTRAMKRRYGLPPKGKPLADKLPDVTLSAKNFAMSITTHNVERHDMRGVSEIGTEYLTNNGAVRETLLSRGIVPEDLPPEEDTKKLARRVKADERRLQREARGFPQIGDIEDDFGGIDD